MRAVALFCHSVSATGAFMNVSRSYEADEVSEDTLLFCHLSVYILSILYEVHMYVGFRITLAH